MATHVLTLFLLRSEDESLMQCPEQSPRSISALFFSSWFPVFTTIRYWWSDGKIDFNRFWKNVLSTRFARFSYLSSNSELLSLARQATGVYSTWASPKKIWPAAPPKDWKGRFFFSDHEPRLSALFYVFNAFCLNRSV